MFDFFKKRFTAKVAETGQHSIQQKELAEKTRDVIRLDNKLANQGAEKQVELARAASFAGQEDAALAFILQSDYADARLQAAMHIHSPEALMQVSQAMRNTDRRVSKLVQEKLALFQKQQKMNLAVQACLSQGQQLLESMPLMVNQVTTWDKERRALNEHDASLLQTKLKLEERLQAQLDLQRQVMQVIGKLRSLAETNLSQEQSKSQLAQCHQEWQEIQSNTLLASLPKNQFQQLIDELAKAQGYVEELDRVNVSPVIQDTLELGEETKNETKQKPIQKIDVDAVLAALEQALQEGSLQQALDLDKSLRKAAVQTQSGNTHRLNALRVELNRLLDWAKWSGNVSREELIHVADQLSLDKPAASEIVKQVGGLRARWKELDRTSGGADGALWERFDAACSRAYNIADAYFKQRGEVRLANLTVAKAQLAAMDEGLLEMQQKMQQQSPDWKAHQTYLNKVKLDWRAIGSIDRKLRERLDVEFNQKLTALSQPLTAAQAAAKEVRQQLIRSVTEMIPTEREIVKKVQEVQQRWQQEARHLPLEKKDEKALWRQFRAACDAIFAQRKANVDEQHQRRNQLILAKQARCEEIEKMAENSSQLLSAEMGQVLRKAKLAWRELSNANGKHKPDELDTRFNTALKKLEQRHSKLVAEEKKAMLVNLRAKINLCRQIESAKEKVDQQNGWNALATNLLPPELNKLLTQRFSNANNAVAQHENGDANAQVEALLLRIELLRGLPSPPELAQQRLQLQVSELQSALKNRDAGNNYLNNFYALCALPVSLDAQQEQRFEAILNNYLTL